MSQQWVALVTANEEGVRPPGQRGSSTVRFNIALDTLHVAGSMPWRTVQLLWVLAPIVLMAAVLLRPRILRWLAAEARFSAVKHA